MRILAVVITLLALVSCSRDPQVAKRRYVENGNKYFARGKYKEASIMYRSALQKDMRYGEAHYRLALAELKLGRLPSAVSSLRRAAELIGRDKPEHWDASIKLAEIYLAVTRDKQYLNEVDTVARDLLKNDANSYDGHRLSADLLFVSAQETFRTANRERGMQLVRDAIGEYRRADAIKPGQIPLRMALARALAVDRQLGDAEQMYQAVLQKDKNFAPGYTELYQLYVIQNKLPEAEALLKSAIANNPKHHAFITLLAAHYYGQKRRDDMVRVLGDMKARSKDFPQAYLMAGDFYLRVGDPDSAIREYKDGIAKDQVRKLEYQKRIIEVLMRQGKKAEAAEMNGAILKDRPKDNDARGLEASLLLDKGEVTRAVAELQAVVSSAPENFVARFHLGRAHMARGEWEQARQQFTKAISLRPDYVLARQALAQLQVTRGEFEAAVKTVGAILQIDPQNYNARLIQSAALMGMKKYDDSRGLLQKMLAASPNSADAHFQLGVISLAENRYKDAEESFRKAYSINPANARGLMGVVETYMAQGKTEPALQLLQTEVQKNPTRNDYRLALGNAAVRSGRFDMALGEYQQVLKTADPKSRIAGDVYLRIGETHRRKGDLNNAIAAFQKSREVLPENSVVLSSLALALDSAGRKPEARLAYEATLKLDPANGVALNNLAFLMAEAGADLDQALTFAQRAKQAIAHRARGFRHPRLDLPEEEPQRQRRPDLHRTGAQGAQPLHLPLPPRYGFLPEGRSRRRPPRTRAGPAQQPSQGRSHQDPGPDVEAGLNRTSFTCNKTARNGPPRGAPPRRCCFRRVRSGATPAGNRTRSPESGTQPATAPPPASCSPRPRQFAQ